MTPEFDKTWSKIGLDDEDLKKLQEEILKNPKCGEVIQGTGGLRKTRLALEEGKSGGARVLYVDLEIYQEVYLITAYPKSKKENLTQENKATIKKMIGQLKESAGERRKKYGY